MIPHAFNPLGKPRLYPFVQPSLSANGAWGGSGMAVRGVNEPLKGLAPWRSFFIEPLDTNQTECYLFERVAGEEAYLEVWYPHGLIVRSIDFVNSYYLCGIRTFGIIGITASGAEIDLSHYSVGATGRNARWSITLPEYNTPCTVIRFIFTSTNPETGQIRFAKVFLNALTPVQQSSQS